MSCLEIRSRVPLLTSALVLAFTFSSFALAAAPCNVARGRQVFSNTCAMCHVTRKGAPSAAAPNLYGVVARKPASLPDFTYSTAMRARKKRWTAATLSVFIANPQATVPGTYMAFTGIKRAADRAAVICYLESLEK